MGRYKSLFNIVLTIVNSNNYVLINLLSIIDLICLNRLINKIWGQDAKNTRFIRPPSTAKVART